MDWLDYTPTKPTDPMHCHCGRPATKALCKYVTFVIVKNGVEDEQDPYPALVRVACDKHAGK